ncbi:MAG: hypothetical protein IKW74_06785 [Thermoguttaceae bacterium]|nr:hypothetical protein [Thermoguttaceae bacterium]
MSEAIIRNQTVNLISKILHPLTESNLIPFPEYREIVAQLRNIANKGEPLPVVVPKLVTMEEAASMLGISLANFKKQEPYLPFKRKYVGHGIRYRNTDVIRFILADSQDNQVENNHTGDN